MIGDIVGQLGRQAVQRVLPGLRTELGLDVVIANAENVAGGRGLTNRTAQELFEFGVDILTSGNHIWEQREAYELLDSEAPIIRPHNYPPDVPGRGSVVHKGVGVLNLIGRTFMGITVDCPFRGADGVLDDLRGETRIILVDMHAEATSEKMAIGFYLDGRVSAVVGTHTHVATADTRLLPKGTAYVSDLGMCGARDAIIGWEIEPITERFLTQLPTRFSPVDKGAAIFNSVMIELDDATGRARSIVRVDREIDG